MCEQFNFIFDEVESKTNTLVARSHTLIHCKITQLEDEDLDDIINVYKNGTRVDNFAYASLADDILYRLGISDTKFDFFIVDETMHLCILKLFISILKLKMKFDIKIKEMEDLRIILNNEVIYQSNIIFRDIL